MDSRRPVLTLSRSLSFAVETTSRKPQNFLLPYSRVRVLPLCAVLPRNSCLSSFFLRCCVSNNSKTTIRYDRFFCESVSLPAGGRLWQKSNKKQCILCLMRGDAELSVKIKKSCSQGVNSLIFALYLAHSLHELIFVDKTQQQQVLPETAVVVVVAPASKLSRNSICSKSYVVGFELFLITSFAISNFVMHTFVQNINLQINSFSSYGSATDRFRLNGHWSSIGSSGLFVLR